ncbi:MAG TPA: hypothetical protein VMS29_05925 [Pyrinomonadaceae bacterium]|jgi:hypothetical protein|nr:hypothetical protein [Pyrinomonadaceae bacterium]
MTQQKRLLIAISLVLFIFVSAAPVAYGKPGEFDAITNHLKTKYRAKKVSVPFMWLARAAVKVVRPAGVKSFNVTIFEDLKFSRQTLDKEMRQAMRSSFGPEWTSVFNVRSRDSEQVYMYLREDGKNFKIALVTIDGNDAVLIRATFSPDKLAEFIENPKILGISLDDKIGR